MTVVIKDNTGSFRDKALGWAGCPISTAGLEMAHFFGGTLDGSLRNFSYGKDNSTATGVPTVKADSVSLQGRVNFINTAMPDGDELTLVVAFKPIELTSTMVAGNFISPGSGSGRKVAMALGLTGIFTAFRGTDIDGNGAETPTPLVMGVPVCIAMRTDNIGNPHIYAHNLTLGEVATKSSLGVPSLGGPIRIGGAYNTGGWDGKTEIYAALGFSRKLTDAELATLYAWLKGYCVRRNIVI